MIQWLSIKSFEGLYEVSNKGNVRNAKTLKSLCIYKDDLGYMRVDLYKDGKRTYKKVHRLVAEAFIPNPENKPEVDHINTDKSDNRVENLRWVTRKENNNNILTRKHRSENMMGHKGCDHSAATRKRISDKLKGMGSGEKNPMYGKKGILSPTSKPVLKIDKNTLEILAEYESGLAAQEATGIKGQCISAACRGIQQTAGGYIWQFKIK